MSDSIRIGLFPKLAKAPWRSRLAYTTKRRLSGSRYQRRQRLAPVSLRSGAFLSELGAGCSIPAGAYAFEREGTIVVSGVMLAPDGSKSVRNELSGTDAEQLGTSLARQLRDNQDGASLLGWDARA